MQSPYNLYRRKGLPPGPICSPDTESVRAVLHPATIDAIYFVADARGRHVFNVNKREHDIAKRRWKEELRRIRREEARKKKAK